MARFIPNAFESSTKVPLTVAPCAIAYLLLAIITVLLVKTMALAKLLSPKLFPSG